jgi:hypothetical protein
VPYFRRVAGIPTVWLALIALTAMSGCAGKSKQPEENKAADHLRKIGQAFDLAIHTGRVPHNAEELKSFLKELYPEDPDELLRSPNDGQPYEIMWGVNFDDQPDINAIFAHEKNGVAGKRYVITVARIVMHMTDDDFDKASFAEGKKPKRKRKGAS